tara:strand:- start:5366 stop:5893 length:528 start_codon:yes stop_codon:yes gene_type:complete
MDIQELQFNRKGVTHTPLKYWSTGDNTNVAIYQGSRGENPDLDFIVKYREQGKRLRTPSHTHWIVDLLVKCEHSKETVGEYVQTMLDYYDRTEPFGSVEERDGYELSLYQTFDYDCLNQHGYYSIETLTAFIELFVRCEKQSTGAFMFRTLLELVKDYCDGKKDFYQIIGYSKRV